MLRLWQHSETGRMCWATNSPGAQWQTVPIMYEDELPESMTDAEYSQWFDLSTVDGVRIGPLFQSQK